MSSSVLEAKPSLNFCNGDRKYRGRKTFHSLYLVLLLSKMGVEINFLMLGGQVITLLKYFGGMF